MIGTFRLAPNEALALEFVPPATCYWSVTLKNIRHGCTNPRRRTSSIINADATTTDDGPARVVVAAPNPGAPNWTDTGGRHRGFITLRWIDDPEPPTVASQIVSFELAR